MSKKSLPLPASELDEFEGHTPLIKQFLGFKKKIGDALLFFRVGDFYEIFLEDAERASKLLDIALTKRGVTNGVPCAMAGVPWMALDTHLAKLSRMGVSAAVVDQIGDPATSKGPVERALVRVVTPGTLLDESLLEERKDPVLLSLCCNDKKAACAVFTLATGSAVFFDCPLHDLTDELARISPAEIIAPESLGIEFGGKKAYPLPAWRFDAKRGKDEILAHFDCKELNSFDLDEERDALILGALCAAWTYCKTSVGGRRPPIEKLSRRLRAQHCIIDSDTRRALELFETSSGDKLGSVFQSLDECITPMGSRLLHAWLGDPYSEQTIPVQRHEAIDSFIASESILTALREALKGFPDAERAAARLAAKSSRPRDFITMRRALERMPDLRALIQPLPSELIQSCSTDLLAPAGLLDYINQSVSDEPPLFLRDGGFVRPGFNPNIDELRDLCDGAESAMAQIEEREKAQTGIATLHVDFNRAHGFSIEVSKAQSINAPAHWRRRQTLKNSERYITDELALLEERVLGAKAKIALAEKELFEEIQNTAGAFAFELMRCAKALACLDCLSTAAHLARERNYTRPHFTTDQSFSVQQMRHPSAELLISDPFIPNDLVMGGGQPKALVITGPNMGGKSTLMRSAALCCALALSGLFVPAQAASIPQIDALRARAGASDDTGRARSTFMTEMAEAAQILRQSTPKTFCIIDEIGRGTSTHDGMSLAWACLRHLAEINDCLTLFSTHYFEIAEMAGQLPNCANFRLDARAENGRALFLRKLVPGMATASMGLEVARMAGLPEQALAWARATHAQLASRHLAPTRLAPDPIAPQEMEPQPPPVDLLAAALEGITPDALTPLGALEALYALKRLALEIKK